MADDFEATDKVASFVDSGFVDERLIYGFHFGSVFRGNVAGLPATVENTFLIVNRRIAEYVRRPDVVTFYGADVGEDSGGKYLTVEGFQSFQ